MLNAPATIPTENHTDCLHLKWVPYSSWVIFHYGTNRTSCRSNIEMQLKLKWMASGVCFAYNVFGVAIFTILFVGIIGIIAETTFTNTVSALYSHKNSKLCRAQCTMHRINEKIFSSQPELVLFSRLNHSHSPYHSIHSTFDLFFFDLFYCLLLLDGVYWVFKNDYATLWAVAFGKRLVCMQKSFMCWTTIHPPAIRWMVVVKCNIDSKSSTIRIGTVRIEWIAQIAARKNRREIAVNGFERNEKTSKEEHLTP